jgi:mono/diheme cytochrome c family protein
VSRRRLVLVPVGVFAAVVGLTLALAKLHLAQPGVPKSAAGTAIALGDPYRGQIAFNQTCAACHGQDGKGGGVGPKLQGDKIPLSLVQARIELGKGVMPAGLVSGAQESNVLGYVATIIAAPAGGAGVAAGQTLFSQRGCASCHGQGGQGGGIGPKLSGRALTEAFVRTRIAQGKGVMPAGLVSGTDEDSLIAYLRSIAAVK